MVTTIIMQRHDSVSVAAMRPRYVESSATKQLRRPRDESRMKFIRRDPASTETTHSPALSAQVSLC